MGAGTSREAEKTKIISILVLQAYYALYMHSKWSSINETTWIVSGKHVFYVVHHTNTAVQHGRMGLNTYQTV